MQVGEILNKKREPFLLLNIPTSFFFFFRTKITIVYIFIFHFFIHFFLSNYLLKRTLLTLRNRTLCLRHRRRLIIYRRRQHPQLHFIQIISNMSSVSHIEGASDGDVWVEDALVFAGGGGGEGFEKKK